MLKKILIFIDRFGLVVFLLMSLVAFVTAVIETMPSGTASLWSVGSAIINTITSDAKDSKGATKLMHVLLTVTLGWAAIKVYMATAGYRLDAIAARYFARQHIVIMAGQSAEERSSRLQATRNFESIKTADQSALAIDIALALASNHNVVLNIPGLDSSRLSKLWGAGVKVLNDDMELPELLQAVGINRAKMLIAMRDAYPENIALTRSALSTSIGSYQIECKCMIEPLEVKQKFKLEDYLEENSLDRVRIFNEAELIARCIVRDHPPDALVAQSNKCVHVLLVGFGSVGQSIAIQLARMGHYRNGRKQKPKITIVDKQVNVLWQKTLKMRPTLPDWLTVELEESRIEDLKDSVAEKWLKDESPITMVYVCTKNEIANLKIARLLLRLMDKEPYRELSKVQVITLDPPGGCVLEEFSKRDDNKNRFKLFSLMKSEKPGSSSPVAANFLSETDDDFAKALHEDYCKNEDIKLEKDPGLKRKPAHKPWDQLAETYREANRSSADHIEIKLRAVGRALLPRSNSTEAPLSSLEIELLAEMEHNRWWAERSLDGWKYSSERNDQLFEHPNMIHFEDLDEDTKEYDRKNVTKMIEIAAGKEKILALKSE